MREFVLSTSIDARPQEVWSTVAGFERYSRWHPLVERLTVDTHWSTRLKLVVRITRRVRLSGTLLDLERPRLISWDGSHPVWGLLRVKYRVEIVPTRGASTVIQTLRVGGLLPRLVPGALGSLPDALAEAAHALKREVERHAATRLAA